VIRLGRLGVPPKSLWGLINTISDFSGTPNPPNHIMGSDNDELNGDTIL